MKQVRSVGLATVLLCITALLIAAFMVLFSYAGFSTDDRSEKNSSVKTLIAGKPTVENIVTK